MAAIKKAAEWKVTIYTDGSKVKGALGMVAGACYESEERGQGIAIGSRATVKDGEIEGIKEGIQHGVKGPISILSDSQVAIMTIVKGRKVGNSQDVCPKGSHPKN